VDPPLLAADSGVRIVRTDRPSVEDIEGLVFAPGVGLVALDEADDIWVRAAKGWKSFHRELPVVRIGWDREAGLLLYQFDERILYSFHEAKLRPTFEKFHSELLGASAAGGFVMVRFLEGAPTILFARDGKIRQIVRVSASSIFDAAGDSRGRFWFSTADGLWIYEGGKTSRATDGLWKPNNIVAVKNMVFVWSEDRCILYRVNTDKRMVEALD
jgi:hypothetical protein